MKISVKHGMAFFIHHVIQTIDALASSNDRRGYTFSSLRYLLLIRSSAIGNNNRSFVTINPTVVEDCDELFGIHRHFVHTYNSSAANFRLHRAEEYSESD